MMKLWVGCALVLACLGQAHAQFVNGPDCPANPVMPDREVIRSAMASATDRGFLWRIEKDGMVSHLFGTMHLGQFEWMFPGPQLTKALASARFVALELNPFSPDTQAYIANSQRQSILPIPPQVELELAKMAKELCVDPAVLKAVNQESIFAILTLANARKRGLFIEYGSEVFLAGFASGAKKTVVELENAALQSKAIKQSLGEDPDWQIAQIWIKDYREGKSAKQLEKMVTAWNLSDFATFEQYEKWCDCLNSEEEQKRWRVLNDDRNDFLALRIAQEHEKSNGSVVAAIGSLHFTGPKAVQQLLAKQGFTVTRLVPAQ